MKGIFVQIYFFKCSPTLWVLILRYDVHASFTNIPPVGDLPEIEECLYLTTTMECNSFQI